MKKRVLLFKRVAITTIALTVSALAVAQDKGDMAVGINVFSGLHANKTYSVGIGAKILYNVTAPIRLVGEADFSTGAQEGNYLTSYSFQDFSLYGHYLFPVENTIFKSAALYPLVGVGLFDATAKLKIGGKTYSESDNRIVVTLGGGTEFGITNHWVANAELRIKLHGGNHFLFVLGMAYKF